MFAHIRVLIVALMTAGPVLAQAQAAAQAKPVKMVVLGDSLSAGLGLPASAAFPARLAKGLGSQGHNGRHRSMPGCPATPRSGGRDRLDWSMPEGTEAVILELGANDALRGTDPAVTRAALDRHPDAAEGAQDRRADVRNARPAQLRQRLCRRASTRSIRISPNPPAVSLYPFFRVLPLTPNAIRPTACIRRRKASTLSSKNILPTVEAFLGAISRHPS